MEKIGTLTLEASGDREIVMTRVFDAPRDLVFDAWTKPELLKRWLGARAGWSLAVCDVDLTVGGRYRFVWRGPDGDEMGARGIYHEIVPPERLVNTEVFDDPWYEGEGLITTEFAEQDRKTTARTKLHFESKETRDDVIDSPMKVGVAESYDQLADVLAQVE